MNYTTKKQPRNLLELEVTISPEEMKDFYQQALGEMAKETTVSGFRPGKAPLDLVERQTSKIKVLERAADIAINRNYREIVIKEKIWPIGEPKIELLKLAPDNPLVFKITITLMPKVKLGDYKKIKVQAKPVKIEEKDVQRVLQELQQMRRKEAAVKRPAQLGDRAEVDLEMFIDKVLLENGQVKNLSVILGQDFYIPGLSQQLVGLTIEQTKEFNLQYPADHFDKKLAGKKVDFKVKLNNLYQIDLPELNDGFAQGVGKFKGLAELRDQLKDNLAQEAQAKENDHQEVELLKQLVEKSTFEELPEILIESELDKVINELQYSIEAQGLKFDDYLMHLKKTRVELRKDFVPKAEARVKTAIAINEVAEQEKIVVDDKELDEEVGKMIESYREQPDLLEHIQSNQGRNYLYNVILNRKVIAFLKK
jgi:trigger factor